MIFIEYIILAAGFAFAVYEVRFKDAYKASLQEIWLPPGEKNQIFRGKDGYYSEKKGWIVDGIVAASGLLFAFLAPWDYVKLAVGLVFAGIGLFIHLAQEKDWKRFKRNLAEQKALLEQLRKDPEGDIPLPHHRAYGASNVWVVGSFYDFREPSTIPFGSTTEVPQTEWAAMRKDAREKIQPRLAALAKKPESEWFKEDRAK